MLYWTTDGTKTLRDLAAEHGLLDGSSRRVDKEALKRVCAAIPYGRWTTYGDIAAAIGVAGAAQSVSGVIATDPGVKRPRVLRASGQVSPGWVSDAGEGPEHARARLEAEGVTFDAAGVAGATCRSLDVRSRVDRRGGKPRPSPPAR